MILMEKKFFHLNLNLKNVMFDHISYNFNLYDYIS